MNGVAGQTDAALAAPVAGPDPRTRGRRVGLVLVLLGLSIGVSIYVRTLRPDGPPAERALAKLPVTSRSIEGRPSIPLPWVPYRPGVAVAPPERLDATLRALEEWNRRDPRQGGRPLALALLWRGGEGDLARAEQLLAAAPNTADRENERAVWLLAAGRPAEALAVVEAAVARNPRLPAPWFNRAIALTRLGRTAEARAALELFVQRSRPDDPWAAEARERLAALASP